MLTRRTQNLLDALVLTYSFGIAYLLRFDFSIPVQEYTSLCWQLPMVLAIQMTALYLTGVYRFIWRYTGMAELRTFMLAAVSSMLLLIALRLFLPDQSQQFRVPLSITMTDTVLAFGGVLGIRIVRRAVYERYEKKRYATTPEEKKRPVLLIGAGRAGGMTAREILARGDLELQVKGFIDDDRVKRGTVVQGVKVVGTTADLPRLCKDLSVDHVVITIAKATRRELRRILDLCESVPVNVKVIPGIHEILQGEVNVSRIRNVQIEDLLGREAVKLDGDALSRFVSGKVVMVTGAGGSIGSEIARQVARFSPRVLVLVERSEPALFNTDRELRSAWPDLTIVPLIADVGDEVRMRGVFISHEPQIIFHAAAHKHVPMMEANPGEAIKNNTLATQSLGELAGEFDAEAFVLISTDKAVRPTSIMGASKRVAELVVQWLDERYATRFVAVRFGNVIGSAGSVIPIFREQIDKGGPVTVTHPNMKRYFMTIPEASQLVIQAGAIGGGGEIFILDMGEPVNILELAKETINLSGLKPYEDIDIVYTGMRPGEKLFEELEMTGEMVTRTRHPKIFIGKISKYPDEQVRAALDRLRVYSGEACDCHLRAFLQELLPESNLAVERTVAEQPLATVLPQPERARFASSAAD